MRSRIDDLKAQLNREVSRVDEALANSHTGAEEKIQQLMESLHVYQTELEMQNVALSESNNDNQVLRQYYSSLFALSPLPSFVVDTRLNILESNQAAKELFKLSKYKLLNQVAFTSIFDTQTSQTIFQRVNSTKKEMVGESLEVNIELIDGHRTYRGYIKKLLNPVSAQDTCLLILHDITSDKQLLKQQSLFTKLLDNAKEMLMVTNVDGEVISCSEHLLDFFALTTSENLIEHLPKALANPIVSYLGQELLSKRSWKNTIEVVDLNGVSNRYLYLRCFPILEDGKATGAGFILYDDTQRIIQEQELSLAIRVFNEGTQAIMITDAQQNIIQVNLAFEEITGYVTEEVIGEKPSILKSDRQDKAFYRMFWKSIQEYGTWEGEIWNKRKDGEVYAQWLSVTSYPKYAPKPTNYIAVFRDITDQKQKEKEIYDLAHYDPLTHCGNRRKLKIVVDGLLNQKNTKNFSVFLFDLDLFKVTNDVHGHEVGDLLLQALVERIKHVIRDDDQLFRIGGDEFLLLFDGLPEWHLWDKANELINASKAPFYIKNKEINTAISIGIAKYPDDGHSFNLLLKHADAALYSAKDNGRKTFEFFDPSILNRLTREELIERHLRSAISKGELTVAYMPIVCYQTECVESVELLLRWNNKELGVVGPDEFIPVAEKIGIIHELTEHVFSKAAELIQVTKIHKLSLNNVSLNLSSLDFKDPSFLMGCIGKLSKVVYKHLTLEITESILLKDTDENIATIQEIREKGIKVSIDDFGTGYSSLGYLSNFSVDEIKIDKSFVDGILTHKKNQRLCKAIIGLIKALDCHSVAEGVESKEQADWLKSQGCNLGQGYFHSKPIDLDELQELLKGQPKGP